MQKPLQTGNANCRSGLWLAVQYATIWLYAYTCQRTPCAPGARFTAGGWETQKTVYKRNMQQCPWLILQHTAVHMAYKGIYAYAWQGGDR
jgi:hypothetical protein